MNEKELQLKIREAYAGLDEVEAYRRILAGASPDYILICDCPWNPRAPLAWIKPEALQARTDVLQTVITTCQQSLINQGAVPIERGPSQVQTIIDNFNQKPSVSWP